MKEIIVIEKEVLERLIKALPVQWFDNKEKGKLVIFGKEYQTEKEPTNWEELKELCEDLEGKNVFIINAGDCIEFNGLYFWKDGSITTTQNNNDIWATKTNLTSARQWQIIKNLIGEE